MTINRKQTSGRIASKAGATLASPNSSKIAKSLSGSALAQTKSGRQTGAAIESKASKVLSSSKYSTTTQAIAASLVSQSNKKR